MSALRLQLMLRSDGELKLAATPMTASHRPALGIGGGRRTPSPFRLGLRSHFGEGSSVARRRVAAVVLCAATAFALAVPVVVGAASHCATLDKATATAVQLAECGLQDTAAKAKLDEGVGIETMIGNIIENALTLVGVVFLILMIYGGIRWMVARGETDEITKAKDIIKAAIIGIVIVALAFAITNYVVGVLGEAATTSQTLDG